MKERIQLGIVSRYWWMPLIVGILALALGVWTVCCPQASLPVLAYTFAACLVFAGVVEIVFSVMMSRHNSQWGWSLAIGILDILAGAWMFCMNGPEAVVTFMIVVGIWILCVAVNSICESIMFSSNSTGWMVWMVLLLIATIVLAWIFLSNPIEGGIIVWLWIGISLICYGVYRMVMAFNLRRLGKKTQGII